MFLLCRSLWRHRSRLEAAVLDPHQALLSRRDDVVAEIIRLVGDRAGPVRPDAKEWAPRLVDALAADLGASDRPLGQLATDSAFLTLFKQAVLDRATTRQDVTRFQDVISCSASGFSGSGGREAGCLPHAAVVRALVLAEDLLTQARTIASRTAESLAAASQFAMGQQAVALTQVGHILTTVTDMEELKATLAEELPKLGIRGCFVTLLKESGDATGWAQLHFASTATGRIAVPAEGIGYRVQDVLPAGHPAEP